MTIIKDTFFGGAEKKAAKASQAGTERGIEAMKEATRRAENFAIPLFSQARQDLHQGFQGALDVFGQSLPAQTDVFTQGNLGAQQAILSGLPQMQNALFGNQVDLSQLQPFEVQQPDLGFFQQTLPQDQLLQGAEQPEQPVSGGLNVGPQQTPVLFGQNSLGGNQGGFNFNTSNLLSGKFNNTP